MLCKKLEAICCLAQDVCYLQVSYTTHEDYCHAQYLCLIIDALVQMNPDHVDMWLDHEVPIPSPAFAASS